MLVFVANCIFMWYEYYPLAQPSPLCHLGVGSAVAGWFFDSMSELKRSTLKDCRWF